MKAVTKISILLLSSISLFSYADNVWHQSKLEWIYPQSDGVFAIGFENNSNQCSNGNSTKYHHVKVGENGVTEEGLKLMYSAALAALASDKEVNINYDSSTNYCYVNRMILLK